MEPLRAGALPGSDVATQRQTEAPVFYRVHCGLVGLQQHETGMRIISMGEGTILQIAGAVPSTGQVDALLNGTLVSLFVKDLNERAERI